MRDTASVSDVLTNVLTDILTNVMASTSMTMDDLTAGI